MVAAAVVTGNCVVYKPSSLSPVTGHLLVDIFREAGLPPGVFNYVPCGGGGLGDRLVDHADVALIAFTGSREVGLRICERAAKPQPGQRHIKKVITELGGKNAIIVDEDADIEAAVPRIVRSAFAFQGQKCSACSRVIVLESVYDEVLERLVSAVRSLRIGPPESYGNDVGPVVEAAAQARIMSYIDSPEVAGRIVYRSEVPDSEVAAGAILCACDHRRRCHPRRSHSPGRALRAGARRDAGEGFRPCARPGRLDAVRPYRRRVLVKPGTAGQGGPAVPGRQSLPEPSDNWGRGRPATVWRFRPLRRGDEGRRSGLPAPFHESTSRHGKVPMRLLGAIRVLD